MAVIESAMLIYSTILTRVKTGSGHPGQPYHILSGSNGSKADLDSALYHVH